MRPAIFLGLAAFTLNLSWAKCTAELLKVSRELTTLQFHDGRVATALPDRAGVAGSATRAVVHLQHADGSKRLYKQIYEVSVPSEHAVIGTYKNSDLIEYFDQKYRESEKIGGPKYYGMELVKVGEGKWNYFAVMEDLSTTGEYFTLKGLRFTNNTKVRTAAVRLLHDRPQILDKIAVDLVGDPARGSQRIDPDFVLSGSGAHWIDIDMWRSNYPKVEALDTAAESIAIIFQTLSRNLGDGAAVKQFANSLRREINKLSPDDRQNFLQAIGKHLSSTRPTSTADLTFTVDADTFMAQLRSGQN